jgi:hypothetical protein
MGARLPKDLSSLPKRSVGRRYFVREAEARAEPRRWVSHHQIISLIQGVIVSTLDWCHAQHPARRANWRRERNSVEKPYASG